MLFLCPSDRSISRADSAPEWLTAAGKADLAHFGDGSAAVILGEWTDFTVDATGKFVMTERRAMRVLHRRSADRYLDAVGYENNAGKVTSIQTWSIAPSGRVTLSGKKDLVTIAGFTAFEEFTDVRIKKISIPGAEDGSLVGYEVVTQGRIPISGEKFPMEEELPVRIRELHVSVPSGSLRWFVNHPDRIAVVSQSPNGASFRTENRAAIPDEPNAPPFTSLAAMVVVNYDPKGPAALQSWEQAGHAYHDLFANGEKPETDIASQVETLLAGKSDDLSKIDALYNFVSRQIRYVAIEIGVGGYQPHPAADVYKNKYGDCKDKANLLISMLGKIGLRAYPALVGTRGDVEADPTVPTLATFDHMIVALPIPANLRAVVEQFPAYDGRNRFSGLTRLRKPSRSARFRKWIKAYSLSSPIRIAAIFSASHRLRLNKMDLNSRPQSACSPTGPERPMWKPGTSAFPIRTATCSIGGGQQSEILKKFEERVATYVNQAEFRQASISGIDDSRQQIHEKFSFAGNFSIASGGAAGLQPLFLSGIAVPEVGARPRQLPLDLGTPFHVKCNYRVALPAGMRIERVPDKISAKSEFGELSIEYSMAGDVLLATEILSFSKGQISPEKYPEFRDFVNASIRAERQRLRVVKITP